MRSFTLGHLSDWHFTSLGGEPAASFLNKRALGWLSWNLSRKRVHRPQVFDALVRDLNEQSPDHVAVTGDLTNVALPREFRVAAQWLERLGGPAAVSVVPGNHDAYVPVPGVDSWGLWSDFVRSDSAPPGCEVTRDAFPTLRVRGPVALVGLCSALPTSAFLATGELGDAQLDRLSDVLEQLEKERLFRVVYLHHPPHNTGVRPRKRLLDSAGLREVLARHGAELVLHGHMHRTCFESLRGPQREIPVVGVRSASHDGEEEQRRAQYHLYRIDRDAGDALSYRVRLEIRGYDPGSGAVTRQGVQPL